MIYTLKNIYEDYSDTSDNTMDSNLFRSICSEFNMEIIDHILDGHSFNMGNQLSSISIKRVVRDNSKPTIDWGESNKYKQELVKEGKQLYDKQTDSGTKWYIYYTDDGYLRYFWNKGKCKISNKSVYKFIPTRGLKGNKEKLSSLLKNDDLSYLKFKKSK